MITITIKTDNEAFQDGNRPTEIARILRELSEAIQSYRFPVHVLDINGNRVGTVKVTGKDLY